MDLSELDAGGEAGETMPVCHPVTRVELPGVNIRLVGIDSEKFRVCSRVIINKRLQSQVKRRAVAMNSVEEIETESAEQLANATLGWEGIELDGKVLPFTIANAKSLYMRLPWLREQVDNFVGDRGNFLKPSLKA